MARTVLLGTTKGAFLLGETASGWDVSGPHCDGWCINHVVGDRASGHLWAGGGGAWPGAGVWRSTDGGQSWDVSRLSTGELDEWAKSDPETAAFFDWKPTEAPFTGEVEAIWSLRHSHGTLYAGAKPANLFQSNDGGVTWEKVDGLANHESRETWNPGAAGLVLHTILPDPDQPRKIWVGISAAGVFATEDGGSTWERRNQLANADACAHHHHPAAPRDGQTGHCVHNIQKARGVDGDLLYQQNHHGVYRSDDGGRVWHDITEGLPSTFGFPIGVHPEKPQMIWTVPLNGDAAGRFPPDASAAVWKSEDGGKSWQAKRTGLPQGSCFFTVLRQAMAVDEGAVPGVFFGTNTGSVFASEDEGESWDEIARHLPTILSVEVIDRMT